MNQFVIPSIDLLDGKIVRLYKGSYDKRTEYNISIPQLMVKYQSFKRLHIVDLNGARNDGLTNLEAIKEIRNLFKGSVQLGGGIRTLEIAQNVIGLGIDCVVLGTIAITNPDLTHSIIEKIDKKNVVLAIDCKMENGQYTPKANGWLEDSQKNLFEILAEYSSITKSILITDITVDGTMQGANLELYRLVKERFPHFKVQASGGVSNVDDIKNLQKITDSVIVGKALYEGILDEII